MNVWFKVNKLSLNVSKTSYMIFGKKYTDSVFNIQIDGVVVDRVHVTKFLGVLVDDALTWNNHITSACKNISKNMSMLYKVKHILNSNSLYTLYCSLLLPYFSYACEIWGNTYTSRIENLIMMQKKAIRVVDKSLFRDHTNPLFVKYRCLKFQDVINMKTLLIVHRAKNNNLPTKIQKLFKSIDNTHSYFTRSSSKGNFDVKYRRTKMKSMTISVKGVKLWNELEEYMHNIISVNCFKRMFKKMYLKRYEL